MQSFGKQLLWTCVVTFIVVFGATHVFKEKKTQYTRAGLQCVGEVQYNLWGSPKVYARCGEHLVRLTVGDDVDVNGRKYICSVVVEEGVTTQLKRVYSSSCKPL
jgi:hypothetical protein